LLPGKFSVVNEDISPILNPQPEIMDALPGGILPSNHLAGWTEISFDATNDPGFVLTNGNVGVTLRLWNWRVDAVELVPEPATLLLFALGGLALLRRRCS